MPTPESPSKTILKMKSYDSLSMVAMCVVKAKGTYLQFAVVYHIMSAILNFRSDFYSTVSNIGTNFITLHTSSKWIVSRYAYEGSQVGWNRIIRQ